MVEIYYMDSSTRDQREEHKPPNTKYLDPETLRKLTNVLYYKLNPTNYDLQLNEIKARRGYTYTDSIEISPQKLAHYGEMIKSFYKEHLHTDEEIRFVVSGSGYFDVRDKYDVWIRIKCVPGDLVILPAGIYHRFTCDTNNNIKAIRLFVGEPVWTPHDRPADHMAERQNYLKSLAMM